MTGVCGNNFQLNSIQSVYYNFTISNFIINVSIKDQKINIYLYVHLVVDNNQSHLVLIYNYALPNHSQLSYDG